MAKLPSAQDLGVTPAVSGSRPVGSYDVSPVARVGAAQTATAANLGKAVNDVGIAIGDVGLEKGRFEYATAHAQALTKITELNSSLANDQDYATLPDRYETAANKIYSEAAERISIPGLKTRFTELAQPELARGKAAATSQAFKVEGQANLGYIAEQGDTFINQGTKNPHDTALTNKLVNGYGMLVDTARDRGFMTPEQAVRAKQDWAHRYAIADGVARADNGDAIGVINELRSAPGSVDQIDQRIVQVESNGNPLAQSKTSRAFGPGQFIPETWLPLIKKHHPELADRGDEELLALRADRRLSLEMVGKLREENTVSLKAAGVEGTAGNIYLAHFLGPAAAAAVIKAGPNVPIADALKGAVGEEKAQKMIAANGDILRGQTAGSVAQWANDKMGGVGPGGGHIYDMLRPDQRAMLLLHAEQAERKRKVNDDTEFLQRRADTVSEAHNTGAVEKLQSLEEYIAAYGADRGPKEYAGYKADVQLGQDKARVADLSYDQQDELIKKYDPNPGEGFADAAKRQKVLAAEIERSRKLRDKDPEFQTRYSDSLAEASRTGKPSKPIEKDEFINRFGSRDGPKIYTQYSAELRLGRDAKHADELSPQEQQAMLGGYDPDLQKLMSDTDYATALKRRDSIAKAINEVRKQTVGPNADPAAFAIARLPVVTEAYNGLQTVLADPAAPLETKQAAARNFAMKMEMEQTRIGVAPEDRTLLPQSYVDQFQAKLAKPAAAGGTINVAGMIESEAKIWGDAWPQVYRQVAKGAAPVVMVIGSGVKPAAAQIIAEFANTSLKDIANDQSDEKIGTIKKDVRDAFRPLSRSMEGNEGAQPAIDGFQAAGEKLAAYYVRGGKTSSDAAAQAFEDLLGHKYDFSAGSYRVPKAIPFTSAQIANGVNVAKFELANGDKNLFDQAREQYPILKGHDIKYKESFGRGPGFLESWPAGEPGGPDLPRPAEFGADKFGVEVFDKKTRPIDVVGDVVSHHLVDVDPKLKGIYKEFGESLEPWQLEKLRGQYERAKKSEGETGSFEDWKTRSGLPAYFRGYPFKQWDKAEEMYTPQQMKLLDGMMDYLRSGSRSSLLDVEPARDTIGGVSPDYLKRETARAYARDGQWVTSPDESGLALIYKDQAVRRSDGKPLTLTWAQLARMDKEGIPQSALGVSTGGGSQ